MQGPLGEDLPLWELPFFSQPASGMREWWLVASIESEIEQKPNVVQGCSVGQQMRGRAATPCALATSHESISMVTACHSIRPDARPQQQSRVCKAMALIKLQGFLVHPGSA